MVDGEQMELLTKAERYLRQAECIALAKVATSNRSASAPL
jgi:hypothetical protein